MTSFPSSSATEVARLKSFGAGPEILFRVEPATGPCHPLLRQALGKAAPPQGGGHRFENPQRKENYDC